MSKLLTTGEMIDKLKVGERAKRADGDWNYEIYRSFNGIFLGNGEVLTLNSNFLKAEWDILPNYISFSEAMKAIEEGKYVRCQYNDESITIKSIDNRISSICFDSHCEGGGGASIKIAWIVAGKWTIEED